MSLVLSDTVAGVTTITLNDVDNRNALGAALVEELLDAIDRADRDPSVRAVVLTNAGPVFCAGADLRATDASPSGGPSALELFQRFRRSPKPFVGRIAGHCVAGGMGLAAAMDLAVAVETARFGFTEVRVGVAPAMISVLCLPKMRPADAAAAFLRGTRFPAPEAVRLGLINAAVPEESLDAEIDSILADLRLAGPNALAATKALLTTVPTLAVDEAFTWTAALSAELFRGDEAREGMAAFRDKRRPAWADDPDGG
ncbi:MAG: enoyl-CoA hydratase-related protein [Acidimicrobiales bacterium]